MKVMELDSSAFLVRLDKGDLLKKSISKFHEKHVPFLKLARLEGFGTVKNVDLRYVDQDTSGLVSYQDRLFGGQYNLASLKGILSIKNDKSNQDLNITISDSDYICFSGRLNECEVAITVDIFVKIYEREVRRKYNSELGLFLLDLED